VSESIAVLHPAAIAAGEEASAVVLLVFRIDGCEHAVAVEQVVEVLRMVAATRLPDAPSWVVGVINVRGRVIPLIDVGARLGAPRLEPEPSTSVIVVQTDEVAVGLVVDEVVEVLAVRHDALQRPDQVTAAARALSGVARHGNRLILLLDPERICEGSPDLRLLLEQTDDAAR
jgi:purine-binding chemotaxis protein CheW